MKYIYCFILFGFTLTAFAQENASADNNGNGKLILSFAAVANDQISGIQNGDKNHDLNFGVAALIETKVYHLIGIETGFLWIKRSYETEIGSFRLIQQTNRLHIPVTLRVWPVDFLSFGAGPFIAFQVGDTTTVVQQRSSTVASFESSADDNIEYGLDLAGTLTFGLVPMVNLFIEGRYSIVAGQEDNVDANQISGLAGIKLEL